MKKILIVEDDTVNRKMMVKIVESLGYMAIQSSNGRNGIETINNNQDLSLIITDMKMPEMNGMEFLKQIKQNCTLNNIPIIVVSGVIRLHQINEILELGASYFLPKPINAKDFKYYLQKAIDE